MAPAFEPLGRHHDRGAFLCGTQSLDDYLKQQAMQDVERLVAACWVLCEPGSSAIIGYYTLSTGSIRPTSLPNDLAKRLPRYPRFPTVLIGRLARDSRFTGQGIGEILLYDALQRAAHAQADIAAVAVVVDTENETVIPFYTAHEFQPFADDPTSLYLLMRKVLDIFPPRPESPQFAPPE